MVQGGPLGAIAGIVSGVVGTGLNYYGNDEELRAKQMQIKNSPCIVTSGGSGLGAIIDNIVHVCYVSLKMDDQSMEKLRFMLGHADVPVELENDVRNVHILGGKFRVVRGPFRGLEGTICHLRDEDLHVGVLLNGLGFAHVRINKDDIEKI